ncbi:mannosyltransferase putative-domain-containing protein [Coniochaeta sp. 2T2.1]|nr:mannosyltransferase putative-domain-containing protein [Coniochaeta sp. 2T2.1]
MFLSQRPVSHLPTVAKKTLIVVPLFVFVYFTLTNPTVAFLNGWKTTDAWPGVKLPDVPTTPLNISQWGERGSRVSQLAEWADILIKNPSENRSLFKAALIAQFPYLAGALDSIYAPWFSTQKHPGSSNTDHGFVICAGSENYRLAAHLIRSLRRVHSSSTPIEIAYAGDSDLQPIHRKFLAHLESNITFIHVLERFPAARRDLEGSGWAMKPFALLASAYSRAILMDADAVFLSSPDSLFAKDRRPGHPALTRTGTLFFHDRAAVGGGDERRLWVKAQIEAAGIPRSTYLTTESLFYEGAAWYEADSGVVALDRSNPRVLLGLMFATWMNTKDVRDEITYRIFYGDKESFWLAMELSGFEYAFQPWYAGTMGTVSGKSGQPPDLDSAVEICGTHMPHLDYLGQTPFWINGGIYEHKDSPESERRYADMTHYWVGNTSSIRLTQPSWYWVNGNVACLKETGVKIIPEATNIVAQQNREQALEVDEMIKNLH